MSHKNKLRTTTLKMRVQNVHQGTSKSREQLSGGNILSCDIIPFACFHGWASQMSPIIIVAEASCYNDEKRSKNARSIFVTTVSTSRSLQYTHTHPKAWCLILTSHYSRDDNRPNNTLDDGVGAIFPITSVYRFEPVLTCLSGENLCWRLVT